ncbi:Iroquois-class homeodomain protein IRX-5 [Coniosporium apollinis]|uniref:Iroquois-class homeodomain protein IRX-5 n=2 Tax=Coniosporium TaxID=2810619 RepID=A0ABQ9NZX9_9PEZI|nr:Iroquois-class homeodomain protein IRX-5 [Cladosporium sp. JES 115]KAJ9666829.1 Iroquois-class homeodomain protein IRX-5 [Coniosporium apollinis]
MDSGSNKLDFPMESLTDYEPWSNDPDTSLNGQYDLYGFGDLFATQPGYQNLLFGDTIEPETEPTDPLIAGFFDPKENQLNLAAVYHGSSLPATGTIVTQDQGASWINPELVTAVDIARSFS